MIGGATGKPRFHFTDTPSENQTHDLKCLLNFLAFEQVTIVAVAMSTTIGANFTLLYPERVRALVLCSWYELEGFPLLERRRKSHQMSFADLHLKMRDILIEGGRDTLERILRKITRGCCRSFHPTSQRSAKS